MARFTLLRTFVLGVGLALTVAQGCANQGEGERCEPNAARDADCDDGLVCVPNDQLLDNAEGADDFGRCCPPTGESFSDERCTRVGGMGTGGSGGTGGTTVEAGAGGMSEMGGAPAGGGGAGASSGAGGDVSAAGAAGSGTAGAAAGAGGQSGAPSTAGAGGA